MKPAIMPLALLFLTAGCRMSQLDQQPPTGSAIIGAVEIFRPALAVSTLGSQILASLAERGRLDCRTEVPTLSISQEGMDLVVKDFSLNFTLENLQFVVDKEDWLAYLELEISDPLLDVEFSSDGNVLGSCRALLSVPRQKCSLVFHPEGKDLAWRAAQPCSSQPLVLEPEASCGDRPAEALQEHLEKILSSVSQEALEKTALELSSALREYLGITWDLRISLQGQYAPTGAALVSIVPAGVGELGENGSRVLFSGAAWSRPGGRCCGSGSDLSRVEPPAMESKLVWAEENEEQLVALAVSDGFLEQLLQALWRSGILCPEEFIPLGEEIDLENFLPSLSPWEPSQGHLLIRAPQPPLFTLLTAAYDERTLSVFVAWPQVHFDIYSGCFGGRCRALGLKSELKLEFQATFAENSLLIRLKSASLENPVLLFGQLLYENEASALAAGKEIVQRVLNRALAEMSWPLPILPGTWQAVHLKRFAGRSLWYLKPVE